MKSFFFLYRRHWIVFFFLDPLRPFSVSESRAKVITAFGTRNWSVTQVQPRNRTKFSFYGYIFKMFQNNWHYKNCVCFIGFFFKGYRNKEDGTVIGDPGTVEFTEVSYLWFIAELCPCIKLLRVFMPDVKRFIGVSKIGMDRSRNAIRLAAFSHSS